MDEMMRGTKQSRRVSVNERARHISISRLLPRKHSTAAISQASTTHHPWRRHRVTPNNKRPQFRTVAQPRLYQLSRMHGLPEIASAQDPQAGANLDKHVFESEASEGFISSPQGTQRKAPKGSLARCHQPLEGAAREGAPRKGERGEAEGRRLRWKIDNVCRLVDLLQREADEMIHLASYSSEQRLNRPCSSRQSQMLQFGP